MLISDDYRMLQREMHARDPGYGHASRIHAPTIAALLNRYGCTELLDYGAGKCALIDALSKSRDVQQPFRYFAYEPSDPELAGAPEPAEFVVCLDVLEHIEPDCLDAVLDDLQRVTKSIGLFTVSLWPALKTLPDGRNAHLIVEPPEWWLPKIMSRWEMHTYQFRPDGFTVLVRPKELEHGH